MAIIHAPHDPDPGRLAAVTAEMRELGAPRIRCWWSGDAWIALEGSHRLAAAHRLGLTPVIEAMREDEEIEHDFYDVADRSVRAVVEYLCGVEFGPAYSFDDLERG